MQHQKLVGTRIPQVRLGEIVEGQLRAVRASDIFSRGACALAGMPGAFTPICSEKHLPSLLRNADRLREAGFSEVACVVTSNVFSLEAWAKSVDPEGKVRFLSDGNRIFTRTLGLTTHEPRLFIGECSMRYLMTTRDGVIETLRVEESQLEVTCSNPDDLILEIA